MTEAIVCELRVRVRNGERARDLKKLLGLEGISKTSFYHAINGRNWKHIKVPPIRPSSLPLPEPVEVAGEVSEP